MQDVNETAELTVEELDEISGGSFTLPVIGRIAH